MKLVLIIAAPADGDRLIETLVGRGLAATKIASHGGFLRQGSVTVLSGVEDKDVELVLELARKQCKARVGFVPTPALPGIGEVAIAAEPIEVRKGGATVFVLPVERFGRF